MTKATNTHRECGIFISLAAGFENMQKRNLRMDCVLFGIRAGTPSQYKPEAFIVRACSSMGSLNWAMWSEQVGSVYKWKYHVGVPLTTAPG
jgi:hypothetical protein